MIALKIFELTEATVAHAEAVAQLLQQLTGEPMEFGVEELAAVIACPASHLFIATVGGAVVGMTTIAVYECPTGRKAWIEDVVVDSAYRGKGIGGTLIEVAEQQAAAYAPCTLMLTSRPARVAANAMYRNKGYEQRQTNVYKKEL